MSLRKVNCKTTFEGVYHFTYLSREGGGGVCDNPKSLIEACQEPGSQYVDNEVFRMSYRLCPGISSSRSESKRYNSIQNIICRVFNQYHNDVMANNRTDHIIICTSVKNN